MFCDSSECSCGREPIVTNAVNVILQSNKTGQFDDEPPVPVLLDTGPVARHADDTVLTVTRSSLSDEDESGSS